MLLPVGQSFQQRITSPETKQDRILWRSTLGTSQSDDLPHDSRTFPLRETQPDGIAVLVEPCCYDEGAIAFALKATLGIALPDSHHRVESFLLVVFTQVGHRDCVRRVLSCLHRRLLSQRENSAPSRIPDHLPEEQRRCIEHYQDSVAA